MEEDVRESLPLQKNILKIGYRKKEKLRKIIRKIQRQITADGETSTWEEFLTSTWCRNFHLLVRRILKKDETLGLPDEQETALFETTSAGLHNWKNLAETIYNANLDRILVTDEIGYGIVPIDPFEREYREETGRICCLLAEKSEEVWRVCCGIGTRLK